MGLGSVCRVAAACAACLAAQALHAAVPAANIVSLQGRGDFRPAAGGAWQPARLRQDLEGGDFVRTGDLSQMGILLLPERMQIRLSQNSQLQIKTAADAAAGTQTLIRLNEGRSWGAARGGPPRAPSEPPLRVETPSATLSIRGTDWELEVGPDGRTQLVVLSGRVEMANERGEVSVGAGEGAVAEIGRAPVKVQIVNPRERVQWVVRWRLDPQRYLAGAPADPLATRAAALIAAGQLAQAGALLAKAEATVPVLLMTADLRVLEGRREEAIALARRAVAIDPGSIARAQLARLLLLDDRAPEAATTLQPALAARGEAVEAWIAQGELARFEGDGARARAAYEQARALAPADDRGWGGLGSIAVEREEVAAARELLQKAEELNPRESAHAAERGTLEAFADRYGEAARAFDAALALQPDDYIALTGRGVMKLKQGRPEEALEDFLKAGLIEPRYARAQLYAGIAHYQLGSPGRALEFLARAGELDARDPLPPLFASMIHTDLFEADAALAKAREAMARMPYLKSLNQVANNQKGVANLANALAFRGLKDWAIAYAQDGYYPFWAGSHLFLADLYEGSLAKNSELFQGFLADPTVFGASNRFQSLIHRPGHYQSASLTLGRDRQIREVVPRVTLNGYVNETTPLAYFVDADVQKGKTRAGQPFSYEDETRSVTAALGWVPTHELRLFAFYSRDSTDARYADPAISGLTFRAPFSDLSAGATWLAGPQNQFQARIGGSRIEGTQEWRNNTVPPLGNRFEDSEVSRDAQLGWRARWNDAWDLAAGVEYAESPEHAGIAIRVEPAGTLALSADQRISERSRLGYVSAKRLFGSASYVQLDLVATDYRKRIANDRLLFGVPTFIVSESAHHRLSPRLGYTGVLAPGLRLRLAYQDFPRSSAPVTLGPVATAGIPLDETLVRFGGRVKRAVAKLESELSPRLYGELSLDRRSSRNPDTLDLSLAENLANLTRLRQRNVADVAAFYAGPSSTEYSSINVNTRARMTQARGALNAALTPTLAGSAALRLTDSKIAYLQQDGFYLPRRELELGLTWVSPLRWRVAADAQWRSRSLTFAQAAPRASYWGGNVSAYWETQDKRFSLALFAKDLLSPHASTFYGLAAGVRF